MKPQRRIGLLGGTFDPVHNGHISISRAFLDSGHIDELWVLLTPEPPHKRGNHKTDYEIRLEMLEAAYGAIPRIRISTVERDLPQPSYSIQTLEYLQQQYPDSVFYLCLGGDSYGSFHRWYRYREILEKCNLLVARRPGVEKEKGAKDEIRSKSVFVDHDPIEISSTVIRTFVQEGKPIDHLVPVEVAKIIHQKQLYQD